MNENVDRVINEIMTFHRGTYTLDRSKVAAWMALENVNVIGKLKNAIAKNWNRIVPPLSRAEWGELLLKAVLLGLRDQSDHPYPAYVAAWDYRQWIFDVYRGRLSDPEAADCFAAAKRTLAALSLAGDEDLKDCIVNGVLEHLFEDAGIRGAFEDWKHHPELGDIYRLAAEWADEGPTDVNRKPKRTDV